VTAVAGARGTLRGNGPTVAVLARTWSTQSEAGWALRQVAGAIACFADVHVITPQGKHPARRADGVFTVHELGSAPDPALEARRDVLVDAVLAAGGSQDFMRRVAPLELVTSARSDDPAVRVVEALVTGELAACWEPGIGVLSEIGPQVVVVADYRQVGTLRMLDQLHPEVPLAVVPLGTDLDAMVFPAFAPLFERAAAALVFTESELHTLERAYGDGLVRNVGLPMSANRGVLREPNAYLRERDYVLVLTGTSQESAERSAALARLLCARFARQNVAVVTTSSFTVSLNGIAGRPQPAAAGSDLLRLMAWARAMVDLRPGRLLARRCLESLLYSTPIVVPAASRAQEHALAGGGLWFEQPSELLWCVEAMLDPRLSDKLGVQGRHYAEMRYGSTDSFVENVASAIGLRGERRQERSHAES